MGPAERVSAIRDDAFAARLAADGESRIPFAQVFDLGDGKSPVYVREGEESVADVMARTGESFPQLFVRRARETDGRASFCFRMFSRNVDELERVIASDHSFPSLGDAGAHVSQIMDGDWATFILGYWVRERGTLSLADGVRRMTSGPARVLGLKDRGRLAPGLRADIAVFDAASVAQDHPAMVCDFPGGAPRYIQRGRGYRAVLVNGELNIDADELTGARAGQVIRPALQDA
jgi:N-acyl-D-aspartate/D-glutamate deacylase